MAGEVKSAQVTISEHWHDHVHHKTVGKAPRWDTELGVVCACGEVLGWPDPEHKETLSAYTKRVASERVDAASAPGRVKGAFGTYGGEQAKTAGRSAPVEVKYPGPDGVVEPERSDDDPGPSEPEDDSVDWGEPPADEPEPEPIEIEDPYVKAVAARVDEIVGGSVRPVGVRSMIEVGLPTATEDGDSEDVGTAPFLADAVPNDRGSMISGGESYGQPSGPVDFGKLVDEVTGPETVFEADADLYPDEAQAGPPYAVGDTVIVAGVEFVKHSESPFPSDVAKAVDEIRNPPPPEKPSNEGIPEEEPEVGRDLVPFAGTPLMPNDPNSLDPLNRALPPLDPTLPYTPADVELKILEVLQQGERGERFLREQLARLHQAQHNLDLRYNLAIAKSEARAADQRKAEAWIATERERFEATEAEMLVRALRDNLHNLRAQLSGFQSVARSLGVSLTNALDGRDMLRRVDSHREPPEPPPWEHR